MAKNISLMGADYPDVPAVQLPQTGGGTATFYDINVVDDLNSSSTTDALSANQGRILNSKSTQKTTASGITTSSGALLCSIPSGGIVVALDVTSHTGKIALKRSGDYIHIYTPENNGLVPYANQNVSVDIYYQIFS